MNISEKFNIIGRLVIHITALFTVLKITGYITWSWLWVVSPLWLGLCIFLGIALGVGITTIYVAVFGDK